MKVIFLAIDEMQITGNAMEVVQDPASDEQHGNPLYACNRDRITHRRVKHVVEVTVPS